MKQFDKKKYPDGIFCVYHSRDLDGWCSGAIVKDYCEKQDVGFVGLGWDYGDPIPTIDQIGNRLLVLTDVSFPMLGMEFFSCTGLVWIDHHLSAISNYQSSTIEHISGMRTVKFAACELTWQYFFETDVPEMVELLGRYDSFRHQGAHDESHVWNFQLGARNRVVGLDETFELLQLYLKLWPNFFDSQSSLIKEICKEGKTIDSFLRKEAGPIFDGGFDFTADNFLFRAINRERFNPVLVGIDYHAMGYDGIICFWFKKDRWMFSVYNENGQLDCSEFCKKRGGGGHKGAAGFQVEHINDFFHI